MEKKKEDILYVKLGIPVKQIETIDVIVQKIPNMKRNQFINNLILMGLDDVKLLDSVGLVAGISFFRRMVTEIIKTVEGQKKKTLKLTK